MLADSLYAQPLNMVLSTVGGMAASLIAAHLAHDRTITVVALCVCAIASVRLVAVLCEPGSRGRAKLALRVAYEGGAFVYAALVGLQAGLAIARALPVEAQLVTIGFAIAYGSGIAARNAGNPPLAIGQLFLALAIPIAALARQGTAEGILLAVALGIMFPAMSSVTTHIHRALRRSVTMADTSARLAEKMKAIARGDVLTGLLNRAGLNTELAAGLAARQPGQRMALFWVDLDNFKEVNDLLGHQTGDRMLAEIAARLRRLAPPDATLARFGGDEFILACDVADRRDARSLAAAISEAITGPMRLDGHSLDASGSVGIALLPEDGETLDAWMQAADLALYHAKAAGKRQACFFDAGMTQRLARRREIEAELRQAIVRDELAIHFQPIVDLASGQIRSFEALLRWHHPDMGDISPEEFIPVAEESGAIISLGNWLTARAAVVATRWPADVTLAVNLSPLQIRAPGAALAILSALRDSGLAPHRLELEITESALLERNDNTAAFITTLHRAGVRFALDDFGTGYSSLASLNAYPFSRIKVDRSFVSGIHAGRKSEAIIRAVSGMAATLGMDMVAEGIETAEQARAVRAAGCSLGQGWHYSRAVPAGMAAALLDRDRGGDLPERRESAA